VSGARYLDGNEQGTDTCGRWHPLGRKRVVAGSTPRGNELIGGRSWADLVESGESTSREERNPCR
jgi:hypothetical protein